MTIFCRNFFVSQCRKNPQGNPFVFQKTLVSKSFLHRRGGIMCHGTKKLRGGSFLCIRIFLERRKIYGERWGKIIFSVEKFLSHSAKKFRGGTIQGFRNIRVSKNFMHKKGSSLFSVETSFFSQCRKISWEELFNVSEIFANGKFLCRRRTHHYFLLELFYITVPKNFVRGIIQCFRNIRACEKFM